MKRIVLGITGGIASGKSSVLKILKRRGIPTISSDDLAHASIRKGQPAYREIVHRFGRTILAKGGEIDRAALGQIVFAAPAKRRMLESIIHPHVIRGLRRFIRKRRGIVALDIPLLFEAKLQRLVDAVVVVYCSPSQQLARLRLRSGLTKSEALERLRAQKSLSWKRLRADHVVLNTGPKQALQAQVKKLLTLNFARL